MSSESFGVNYKKSLFVGLIRSPLSNRYQITRNIVSDVGEMY